MALTAEVRLGRARARRWWVSGRRVGSVERAGSFVGDVGFALLFPSPRVLVSALWEAVAGADREPFATGMGVPEQKVWAWKDELPLRGDAWYGSFVAGRGSFLAPDLLTALYAGAGGVDDHERVPLSVAAHEIAHVLVDGPVPSAVLRSHLGDRTAYQRAIAELQRQLLVTNAGVTESASGWPSAVLDLTCRRFDVGGALDHGVAVRRFLGTVIEATTADLARAFRWRPAYARQRLDELVGSGAAAVEHDNYRAAPAVS
ncbi:MAG: AlkZ-related protein [Actinomycetes bacterium]